MTKTPKLAADRLVKRYNGRAVVNGVSLEVTAGEVVGLMGPNGAGKTTLFYMLAGLIRPEGGRVLLSDTDITSQPLAARGRLGISYLPQERSVFRGLSVEDNIRAVLEMRGWGRDEIERRTADMLSDLGLEELASSMGSELSGGEARRLEIARALAVQPSFILMDEPFAGVDPIAVNSLQEIVGRLSSRGIGILISDHNVRETLGVCHRAFVMNLGEILVSGQPDFIAASAEARAMYLGKGFNL